MTDGITLLTPTGDRPEAFALCERWMARQTYRGPLQWLVVDDGRRPTRPTMGQDYVRRTPGPKDPRHTLCLNLRRLLPRVKHEKILIIEDDDYYGPKYLETMSGWLDSADLVAEVGAKYYYLDSRTYHVFREHRHGSLCRTGLTRRVLPTLRRLVRSNDWRLDLRLGSAWNGSRYRFIDERGDARLCVGIKGMPGRRGVTWNTRRVIRHDPDLRRLRHWIGDDYRSYLPYLGPPGGDASPACDRAARIVVYTAIFGGYDRPQIPAVVNDRVRYVLFSDRTYPPEQLGPWELHRRQPGGDPRRENRRRKILAHRWFPEADGTLYLDGNLQLLCDPVELVQDCEQRDPHHSGPGEARLFAFAHHQRRCLYREARAVADARLDRRGTVRRQVGRYLKEGYPRDNGLAWGGCLLRKRGCERFNDLWWDEVAGHSCRDQISLPYALWKTGLPHVLLDRPIPYGGRRNPFLKRVPHLKRGRSRRRRPSRPSADPGPRRGLGSNIRRNRRI